MPGERGDSATRDARGAQVNEKRTKNQWSPGQFDRGGAEGYSGRAGDHFEMTPKLGRRGKANHTTPCLSICTWHGESGPWGRDLGRRFDRFGGADWEGLEARLEGADKGVCEL